MRALIALFVLAGTTQVALGQLADGYLQTWLDKRSSKLEAMFSNRPFDAIGWSDSIQGALELAKKHDRPVFLFTLDGHMDTGRC